MKKFDWNLPMSRKDYAVLCGWSLGLAVVIYAVVIVVTFWDDINSWIKEKKEGVVSN